jgi:hypothetical protein
MGSPRVLTPRQLNRTVLARQLLLDRSAVPITHAVELLGGLQTQYAPSGYVGLWSRVADVERAALTTALQRRQIVQATLMRGTIHMVSRRDYQLFRVGVRAARRAWWLRTARSRRLAVGGYDDIAAVLRAELACGPRPRSELIAAMERAGHDRALWEGVALWLDMVRVPPSGTWERRRADLYGLADTWVGTTDAAEDDGVRHLVRRYLGAFGPATLGDVASWSGVPATQLGPIVAAMRLRRWASTDGAVLLDLPGATIVDGDAPAPVRFLPTWDALLLVHARRSGVLPEGFRGLVFHTKNPQSIGTFTVDGVIAGSWSWTRDRVAITEFRALRASERRAVDAEAVRLAAFHAD